MITTMEQLTVFMETRNSLGIKPGLKRVEYLLGAVDHPEQSLKAVHVAGTNGKGSVIQLMHDALQANGYHVGVFTSPSFSGLAGHFLIDGVPADEASLIAHANELMPAIKELDERNDGPTFFEIITVLAFMYLHKKVDIALIETGMGGRYDTTNCFIPILSIITNVEMDHMQFLGNTYASIAAHKAGIIKPGTPVVTGRLQSEASRVVEEEAAKQHAPLYKLGEDFTLENNLFTWKQEHIDDVKLHSGLKGPHQLDNAAVAFSALHVLKSDGFDMDTEFVARAFVQTTLSGRFEQISEQPFIVLDSAHNAAGISAFIEAMNETDSGASKHLLFAGFKDKALQKMLTMLWPHFSTVTITTFDHERAASLKEYQQFLDTESVNLQQDWRGVVDTMLKEKGDRSHYYITGSLHFITLIRDYINEKKR